MSGIDDRLDELEIRYTLQQDLLTQLSEVVARQGKELERLRAFVDEIRSPRDAGQLPFDPNEAPPHY
ncbi:MAG: SlyX family protein [Polyangia bacterium]